MKKLEDMTEVELAALMRTMAKEIQWVARSEGVEPPMFTLLLWNDPATGQYIGNCDRSDMIKALRETADRLEARQDVPRNYCVRCNKPIDPAERFCSQCI